MPTRFRHRFHLPVLSALSALSVSCSSPTPVHVTTQIAAGIPLAALEVHAVPFSADQVLDSLAAASPRPRPAFPELEARLRQFRPGSPGEQPDSGLTITWMATRDSVARLSARLSRMDRSTAGYREEYRRFRDLYTRYSAREAAREAASRRLLSDDRVLAAAAARAADSLRDWERQAYRDFPEVAEARVAETGRPPVRGTTDSTGRVVLELPPGDWWLNARFNDPENPFIEYRWNVPLRVSGLPFAIPLSQVNAQPRWRH
jgi:hypothetical protein